MHSVMGQHVPENYRQTAAKTANVDPAAVDLQDHMYALYQKLGEIDKSSVKYLNLTKAACTNTHSVSRGQWRSRWWATGRRAGGEK